jgi:hypothetical protein
MAVGYEGYVTIDDNTTPVQIPFLCTGANIPQAQVRLDEDAGYGGLLNNTPSSVYNMAIGSPHIYDWPTNDGSLNFELNANFLAKVIKPWAFKRQSAKKISLYPRNGSSEIYNQCYWNSISLTASEGAFVTGSIGVVAVQRDTFIFEDQYIANKKGNVTLTDLGVSGNIPALNPAAHYDLNPIPFWKTKVTFDSVDYKFISWTVTLSQDIVKFFVCEGNVNPVAPKFLGAGVMTCDFTGEFIILEETGSIPDTIGTLEITIGNSSFVLGEAELQNDDDDVKGASEAKTTAVDYSVYALVS